jgi:hypothetical protein
VILERNYGIAEDMIRELLEDLPHDSGAQEFYELYDRKLAEVIA